MFVLLLVGCCATRLLAADWTEFRGPSQQGHAEVSEVPLRWSETENIAWKLELPGEGWSSPVVANDRVYLTAAVPLPNTDPPDYWLAALCVDAKSGQGLWSTNVFPEVGEKSPRIHSKNSHASPTPIVEGNRLYVHFGHMGTACLDLKGKVLWRNNALAYEPVHGNGGSPVIVGPGVIFSCDGAKNPVVVALNKATGRLAWSTPRPVTPAKTFSFCTPLPIQVNGQTQVIVPGAGAVCAYDPATGEELWHVRYGDGYSVIPRPVYGHGLLYVCTGYDSPSVIAIRPDGHGDVTDTHVAWTFKKGAPHTPSPLLVGDELYVVSDRGVATCLDARSGESVWQERLGGNFSASPVLAAGRIYLQDENGKTHVLAAGRTFEKLAENSLPERTLASLAVQEGTIFLRGDKHLYRIGQ
jgi:outer membrane protein assembly factor BamB